MVRRAKSPQARSYSAASLLPPTLSPTDSNSSNPRDKDLRKNAFVEIGYFFIMKSTKNQKSFFLISEIFIWKGILSGQTVPNFFQRIFFEIDLGGVNMTQ